MNLIKLFEMQRELDERIIKEKGLEGQDLLPQKVLALQVELGECANEWRGFKFWSKNQQPNTTVEVLCSTCDGTGDMNHEANMLFLMEGHTGLDFDPCTDCNATGKLGYENPLLEEYIDCLHFILSIGNEIGYEFEEDARYLHEHNIRAFQSTHGLIEKFNEVFMAIYEFATGNDDLEPYELYEDVGIHFLSLGLQLGFTWEQIEAAYMAKNAVNHDRQSTGY